MRRTFCILSLVAVGLLASASDVFAQRVRVGVGRGGVSVGVGSGYYGSGYYGSPYYGGRGYYYGAPSYYGNRYIYSPYSYVAPTYYYPDAVTVVPSTEIRQSSYADANSATITVRVPNAEAQVWFDDTLTNQRGMERVFHTPALQQGGTYTIKARWTENGRTMDQQRQVQFQPGQSVMVTFQANATERLPSPQPPK